MKIASKLALIIAVMVIPIAVAVGIFFFNSQQEITKANRELDGLAYLEDLRQLFEHVPQHRGTAQGVIGGDFAQREVLTRLEAQVESDLERLAARDQELGAVLESTEFFNAIRQSWEELQPQTLTLTATESFDRHTRLIADIMALMRHIANKGQLIGDPEPVSSYLISAVVERIPEVAENLGVLRGLGNGIAARRLLDLDEQIRLSGFLAQIESGVGHIHTDLKTAFETSPTLETNLGPGLDSSSQGVRDFTSLASNELIRAQVIVIPAVDYFNAGTEAINGFFTLYDASLDNLRGLLVQRQKQLQFLRSVQLGLSFGLTLLAVIIAAYFQSGLNRQIGHISQFFAMVGMGDFTARTEVTSKDELGDLATNLNATFDAIGSLLQTQEEKEGLQQSIQKLLEEVGDVAMGDLTVEAEVTEDFTGAIADSFNYMIEQLRQIIFSVQDTTIQVSAAASEVQATTEHLAEGSESQADQILNTSSAIDEMALSIQQVSENASSAATVADQAMANARQGTSAVDKTIHGMGAIRQQVQETAKRIKRLGESSQEVGEIVGLIGDIADRTSILALNASIQAAMAGEAGRGFAVVAEEVERLAERSAEATKRIGGLIKTIQSETGEAVAAMEETTREVVSGSGLANEAGQTLAEIESVSSRLAEIINSISMSSSQQARGSESVAQSMNSISDVTQQTAAGTKQAAVSIRNLADLADNLRESVSTFKVPTRA